MINWILTYILTEFANLLWINLMHLYISNIFSRSKKRKALLNSFILSNFNKWSLVGMLKIAKSVREIEAIQERAL